MVSLDRELQTWRRFLPGGEGHAAVRKNSAWWRLAPAARRPGMRNSSALRQAAAGGCKLAALIRSPTTRSAPCRGCAPVRSTTVAEGCPMKIAEFHLLPLIGSTPDGGWTAGWSADENL